MKKEKLDSRRGSFSKGLWLPSNREACRFFTEWEDNLTSGSIIYQQTCVE